MPCYAVPASQVIHKMGSNSKVGIEQDSVDRWWRYRYMYRYEVVIYRLECFKGYCYLYIRTLLHLFRVFFKAKDAKKEKLKIILTSFREGFKFYPPIEFVDQSEME